MILYVVCRSVIGFRFPALNILELSSLSAKMFQRCRCYTGLYSVQVSVFPGPDFVTHDLHITRLFIRWGFCIFCEQVVFAGFSAEALSQRILDCKPNFVLTTSGVRRGSKVIKLKEIVDDALERVLKEGFAVGTCLTYANDSAVKREDTAWQEGRDVWWQDVVPKYPKESAVEWVDAEDTLFLLYTSGSTGKPKVCMFKWRTTTLNSLNTLFWTKS
jgi:non-ribosomal peptide synthetase component F